MATPSFWEILFFHWVKLCSPVLRHWRI